MTYNNEYQQGYQYSNTAMPSHVPQQQQQQQQQQQEQQQPPNMQPVQYSNNNRAQQTRSATMSSGEGTPLRRPMPALTLSDNGLGGSGLGVGAGGALVGEPALYLDRLDRLESENVQEITRMSQKLQKQDMELSNLKSAQVDLEGRLEYQTQQRMRLEEALERQEIAWVTKCDVLQRERDQWEKKVQTEETKNLQLRNYVNRKEKEIQKMLQRKYEPASQRSTSNHRGPFERGGASSNNPQQQRQQQQQQQQTGNQQQQSSGQQQQQQPQQPNTERHITPMSQRSPHEILEFSEAMQAAREQYACKNLLDFFGVG